MNVKLVVIFFGFVGLLSACAPQAAVPVDLPQTRIDGLQEVTSKYFDAAFVRPGVDFSRYSELLVSGSELAFRTPDRKKKQFPLAEEQKERFRQLLDAQFANELVDAKNLRMTDSPGPEVLALHVRVQDIAAMISPRSVGNSAWGGIALQAVGEATLVIELRDSESEEILARVFDRRTLDGIAVAQKQNPPVTRWEDVDALCKRWAVTVRKRLDVLVSGNY